MDETIQSTNLNGPELFVLNAVTAFTSFNTMVLMSKPI